MKLRWIAAPALVMGLSQQADAHLRLTSHQSRYGDTQKAGPCGQTDGVRTTDKVYIAKPGTEVTLIWDEYINHPSFYRIDFDLDGDDFSAPILPCADQNSIDDCFDTTDTGPYMVNNITDDAAAVQSYVYTLPDVECTNCTLQVIQAMHDKPPYTDPGNEIYHQCIDIILDNNGPDVLTLVDAPDLPDAGAVPPGPDAGTVGNPDAGDAIDEDPDGCGCQSSGRSGAGSLFLFALGALLLRRRRKRQ